MGRMSAIGRALSGARRAQEDFRNGGPAPLRSPPARRRARHRTRRPDRPLGPLSQVPRNADWLAGQHEPRSLEPDLVLRGTYLSFDDVHGEILPVAAGEASRAIQTETARSWASMPSTLADGVAIGKSIG